MLFKSIGSFLAILTCGLSLHATDLTGVENDSPMPVQQTASAPWEYLSNEIWVNIFKFLPASQDWRNLVKVNKIFGELIKENLLTAGYVESQNPKDIPFTFKNLYSQLGKSR